MNFLSSHVVQIKMSGGQDQMSGDKVKMDRSDWEDYGQEERVK